MKAQKLDTLQAGRAFACLAVVLFHANDTLALPKYLGHDVATLCRAGSSGVQFFFVLSGFVILLAHLKDLGHPGQLRNFAWKRFRRLYPPLWPVLLALVPIFFLVPSFGKGGERSPLSIVLAFLIAPAPYDRLLTPEWTLRHEVVFYFVFAAVIWNRKFGFALLSLWLLLSALLPWHYPGFPSNSFFAVNHLLFGMGMVACFVYRKREVNLWKAYTLTLLGILVFTVAWVLRAWRPTQLLWPLDLCFGAGAALLILGLAILERREHLIVPAFLTFLGEASYSIYLTHAPIISLCAKLLLHAKGGLPSLAVLFLVSIVGVVVGILFHLWVERPLLRWLPASIKSSAGSPPALSGAAAVAGATYSYNGD